MGFNLVDLGTLCIGAEASMLTTSGAAPLEATVPLVLAVSPGLDLVLRMNCCASLGNLKKQISRD